MPENPKFYLEENDPYCYPGTSVLKNLADIHDVLDLEKYEKDIATFYSPKVSLFCLKKPINLELWQNIHYFLFQKVYAWAGELRTIRLSKGNTIFAYPERIEAEGAKIFKKLTEEQFLFGLIDDKLCERLAFYYNELNVLHPFREGNGRTQRLLCEEIMRRQNYQLNWSKITENEHLQAVIQAYEGNLSPLKQLFEKILTPI